MRIGIPLVLALLSLMFALVSMDHSNAAELPLNPPPADDGVSELTEDSAIHCPIVPESDEGLLETLAFSNRGKFIAASNFRGVVKVFDGRSGRQLVSFRPRGEHGVVNSAPVAFAPDGKSFAAPLASGQLALFDPMSGRILRSMDPAPLAPAKSVHYEWAIAVSPDGKTLAGSYDTGEVVLWDVPSGRRRHFLPPHILPASGVPPASPTNPVYPARPAVVTALAFSPDGATLYTAGRVLQVWDLAGTPRLRRFDLPEEAFCSHVVAAPEGATVAAVVGVTPNKVTASYSIILFDATSGKKKAEIPLKAEAQGLGFLPGGRVLVSLEEYREIRLWDGTTTKEIAARRFDKHFRLGALAVSPDGHRIAACGQGSAGIFGVIGMIETDGTKLTPWRPAP